MLVITSYILGAPIGTKEDMASTIRFARSLRQHGVQYNIPDLLVGSPLWEGMKREGVIWEEDWKTNHRVYDYFPEHASREELESLVNDGYASFISAWKTGPGVLGLLRNMMLNPTARRIILGNITNLAALRIVTEGIRGF